MPSTARGPFLNSRTSPSITMPLLTSPNLCRLENSHRVAERIAQPEVDSVGLLGRLLRHLDALREQLLVRLARVIGGEADPAGGRALGDQLPSGLGGAVVHRRRAGLLEQDLAPGVAGDVDGQPAHEAEVLVGVDLEAELADVEVQRLVLVEDEEGVESRGLEHALEATRRRLVSLLQNCCLAATTTSRSTSARPPARRSRGTRSATRRRSRGTCG